MRLRFGRTVLTAALLCMCAGGEPRSAQAAAPLPQDEVDVLISYKTHPKHADRDHVGKHGGKVKHSFWLVPTVAARVSKKKLAALAENPNVAVIEPDVIVHASDLELDNVWGVRRIGGGTAHAGGDTGAGVRVAVIDTGIDYRHPDLDANYRGGWDFVNNDADPMDDNGHGTHCAGTIAAEDNGVGVVGVAPRAELYALKVLDAKGSGSFSSIIAAVQWCVVNGIHVTSNSYGTSVDPGNVVRQAFANANALGIVMVAAAGNSGTAAGTENNVSYPARFDSVISVAATTSSNVRASFSSTGPDVEIAAPGSLIYSTTRGGKYGSMSGTSMACPHVAGAAAVLVGAGLTDNDDVRFALAMSAVDLGSAGVDTWYGYGLVDLATALSALDTPPPPPPPAPEPVSPGLASVDWIGYSIFGGKKNDKNLGVTIEIVDEFGDPVPDAAVAVQVRCAGKVVYSGAPVTDDNGVALVAINGAKAGTYVTVITNVTAEGFDWDHVSPPNSFVK